MKVALKVLFAYFFTSLFCSNVQAEEVLNQVRETNIEGICIKSLDMDDNSLNVKQVLMCVESLKHKRKYDSAVNLLLKCAKEDALCLKALGELVYYHNLRDYYDVVIEFFEKYSLSHKGWRNNTLGGLLLKRSKGDDLAKATILFEEAFKAGSTIALQNLAEIAFIMKDYAASLRYLKTSESYDLKKKDPEQYLNWARLYAQHLHYGFGLEKDLAKALLLYKEIVGLDKTGGTLFLLSAIEFTQGNNKTAIDFLMQSAELGYINALDKLGYLYMKGEVVNLDLDTAMSYYQTSAELGSATALYNQGVIYRSRKEYIKMKISLIKAAKKGHVKSKNILESNGIALDKFSFFDGHLTEIK
ncbi:tetratricopeptide repeat protein [Thalassomonas haliotis]|uniref:Sel1 repeat family protein n=1 Tax=Thalassomonas haliotis TaxID=485448 RepID=A0ABY7VJA6_9GAMM|nr:tetratricopeptide repeat protein [Thalassomonas haliotis]WDE13666.1 sel1 repeat family protein [Thalassomonas haliotis]